MRLSVFSAASSAQLLTDLGKIYQNYLPQEKLNSEALQALIEDEQAQLYVSLFNARHLAAVQVKVNEHQAFLNLLCVRDITRRRGLGKNLLHEVEKQLKAEGICIIKMDLKKTAEDEKEGLSLFMLDSGYLLIDGIFTKSI